MHGEEDARASTVLRHADAGRPGPLIRAVARYAPYPLVRRAAAAFGPNKSKRRRIAEIRAGLGCGAPGPNLADLVRSLRALLGCIMRSRSLAASVAELFSARRHALMLGLQPAMFLYAAACHERIVRIAPEPLALAHASNAPPAGLWHPATI